jgi:transposase
MMLPLSHDIQQNVLSLLSQGFTTRQVAGQCNVSQSTVQNLRKRCLPDADLSRGGRPEKLSPQDKRACVRAVTSGRLDTAAAAAKRLREETDVEASDLTVRRALREAGLVAQEKEAKKPCFRHC